MRRPLLACASSLALVLACNASDDGETIAYETGTGEIPTTGFPGDGDPSGDGDGDGDGDPTGDGDPGDGDPTGDGDGDPTGDGDGDPTGDGDGDPGLGERAVIYELVVRHFGNDNQTRATDASLAQNGVGKFNDVSDEALTELVGLGVTHLYLSGVLRQATLTNYGGYGMPADDPDVVKGRAGNLFAIRDYYDVSPDYALDPTMRTFEYEDLIARAHAASLRVIMDLVPNHVARSYASVVQPNADFGLADDQASFFLADNNFFYLPDQALSLQKPPGWNPPGFQFDGAFAPEDGSANHFAKVTGNDVVSPAPGLGDWYDTIKLNWGYDFQAQIEAFNPIPDTWTRMDAILLHWQVLGVDGFRCDHADLVPVEAWTWLIDQARQRDPEVFFLAAAQTNLDALLAAGFDAVDHDAAYDELKRLYQGNASQASYDAIIVGLDQAQRASFAHFLESHDERRLASPVVGGNDPSASGFGSKEAAYQLAPVLYLVGSGPILVYNGQEVGETGAGFEGYDGDNGRTSIYDYWSLEELSKWTNAGAFDGGLLAQDQLALREWYADLLALSQDPSITASGYWGLEYFNNPGMFNDCPDGLYSFARYEPGSGRAVVVVANFAPGAASAGPVRLPPMLIDDVGLIGDLSVRRVLDRDGSVDVLIANLGDAELASDGFMADVPDQTTHVFVIE